MLFKKILILGILGLILNSCAPKLYEKEESVFIVFKTPTFKHADLGFLSKNKDEVKVQIYGVGQVVMSLKISKDNVCMSLLECMSKENFNKKVLSAAYPLGILENIFKGIPIFEGQGYVKTKAGFTQKIIKQDIYNINYSILKNRIEFRDMINNIVIQVKKEL